MTAVDLLHDRVLPVYEAAGVALERILTDNGREHCGRPLAHLEVAASMNAMPKVVFSRTVRSADWSHTTSVKDDAVRAGRRLKSETDPDMTILGSGTIAAELAGTDLIDTFQVVVNPVALGAGASLFSALARQVELALTTRECSATDGRAVYGECHPSFRLGGYQSAPLAPRGQPDTRPKLAGPSSAGPAARARGRVAVLLAGAMLLVGGRLEAQAGGSIRDAVLGEPGQPTPEISTNELARVLADGSATVLDARPYAEYAVGHIPGALNVAPKPGVPPSAYVSDVAEIGRLVRGDRAAPLVLYCNGPHCGKSKRLAAELVAAGYRNVRRYQLGIAIWRALGGVCQIEAAGLQYVLRQDRTAVVIDARPAASFAEGSLLGAREQVLPGKDTGEVRRAKDDGRLPMEDHNTRIVVVGRDAREARYVAEALAREAFHNVSYFAGSFAEARRALED